tara:strand:+ start:47 stop:205 length:159 start_codon:yes stop_codon:yes gene_type:complete
VQVQAVQAGSLWPAIRKQLMAEAVGALPASKEIQPQGSPGQGPPEWVVREQG